MTHCAYPAVYTKYEVRYIALRDLHSELNHRTIYSLTLIKAHRVAVFGPREIGGNVAGSKKG